LYAARAAHAACNASPAVPTAQARAHILSQVFGAFAAFFAAFGIGANDVANAFATSVGSKALTVKQACAIAVVMEFIGATFLGGEVVKTIRKGIADEEAFEDNAPLLMYGCLCTIFSVGIWLVTACRLEMPVSTTHSCVGGMIGMAIAARGSDAVVWFKDPDPPDKPLPGGFFGVVLSWFLSPICSGVLAALFFLFVRTVLRSKNAFQNSVRVYPLLVFACVTIITLFMLMKGIKSNKDIKAMEVETKVGISFAVGAGVAVCAIPLYMMCKKNIEEGKFVAPPLAIEVAEAAAEAAKANEAEAGKSSTKDNVSSTVEATPESKSLFDRVTSSLSASMNTDVHEAVINDEATLAIHKNAERFDKQSEAMFTYLQVFSACFDALAHGANDVANAVGPFATIYVLYNGGRLGSKQDMGDDRYWILGLGGVGIGVGLCLCARRLRARNTLRQLAPTPHDTQALTLRLHRRALCLADGSQILRAIGVKLAVITPSRGFCIEMGSSTVVILGAYYGLPLSTTHCQVGATMGVALLEGVRGFNKWVMAKTAFGWVFTCVFVGCLSGLLTAFGAYAPTARYPDVIMLNTSVTS
jgi:sodium-dependent phosphate transporter